MDVVTVSLSVVAILLSIPAIVFGARANRRAAEAEQREVARYHEEIGPRVDGDFDHGHVVLQLHEGRPGRWMVMIHGDGTGAETGALTDIRALFEPHDQVLHEEGWPEVAGPAMAYKYWTPGEPWKLPAIRPAPTDRIIGFELICASPERTGYWNRTVYVTVPGQPDQPSTVPGS